MIGIDIKNFDFTVSPSENFYLWSNGGWKESNPIPLEYSSWNTFIALRDLNLERLMQLLNELDNNKQEMNDNSLKLGNYYHSFMNEDMILEQGVKVMTDLFKLCKNAQVCTLYI